MAFKRNEYIRHNILPTNFVVDAMNRGEKFLDVFGVKVGISSTRMLTYTKGLNCVCCPRTGDFFAIERFRHEKSWHLNLYHHHPKYGDVMMTSDHIVAKSRGGNNSDLANRQPMCSRCNFVKGSYDSIEEALKDKQERDVAKELEPEIRWRDELSSRLSTITHCLLKISEGSTEEKWKGILLTNQKHVARLQEHLNKLEGKLE